MRKFLLLLTVILCLKGFSQPTISSFSPSRGPAGIPVTITGTNFSTVLSDNIVYFGSVKATVTAASNTSLAVTVPKGTTHKPVTVTVNNLTAYSRNPFVLTFASGYTSFTDSMFAPKVDVPFGFRLVDGVLDDFNDDGKIDWIATGYSTTKVEIRVLKNTSVPKSFSFESQADLMLSDNSLTVTPRIASADLDGDGKLDLAITNTSTNVVSFFLNTSTPGSSITFSRMEKTLTAAPSIIMIADFDRDGKPDIIVHTPSVSQLAILRNTSTPGNISFATQQNFSTGSSVNNFNISDFDGNGSPDIFILTGNSSLALIFRNTSTPGTFSFAQTTYSRPGGNSIVPCDLNNDGSPDALFNSGIFSLRGVLAAKNNSTVGNIIFDPLVSFIAEEQTAGFCVGDLDGDGKLDYAGKGTSGNAMLIRNKSTTSVIDFEDVKMYTTGNFISSFIADMDGDGVSDLLLADLDGGSGAIMRNRAQETKISSFSPVAAITGNVITINGTNFTGVTAVSFGGTQALSFTVVSDNKITAILDVGGSGKVKVEGSLGTDEATGFTFVLPPTVAAFSPTFGTTGSLITITGTNFISTSAVQFGTASAGSFTVLSPTTMIATVAAGSSGSISITNLAGTVALSGFTFIPMPTISSFAPLSATTGVAVIINGTGFSDVTAVKFGNTAASSFTVLSSTAITAVVASGGSGNVQLTTSWGGNTSLTGFVFTPPPSISVFTPTIATEGTIVSITGTNFYQVAGVSFGDVPALSFTVVSTGNILATVAGGASGNISITTAWQGNTVIGGFSFIPRPTITSFTPLSATTGAGVTITGTNFSDVTNVTFGGVPALSFTVLSPTTLFAVVGNGSSGSISMVARGGGADALAGFTYVNPPVPAITSFTPLSATANTVVTITGTDLLSTTAVSFGGVPAASFTVLSPTTVTAKVSLTGASGTVSLTTLGGIATLGGFEFTGPAVPPVINSVSPLSGIPGSSVNITGLNFNTVTTNNIVYFGATRATVISATATNLTVFVPSGATYAPVTVLNADNYLSSASQAFFLPVFTAFNANISPSDLVRTNFSSGGSNPSNALSGDMDGDGKPDLVIINSDNNKVAFLLNTTTGANISFGTPVMVDAGTVPFGATLADMDGDGRLDVVITKLISGNNVQILLNRSTPGVLNIGAVTPFNGNISLSTGNSNPPSVAVADIDGDGKLDMVVSNTTFNRISFFLNTGTPGGQLSFAAPVNINQTVANNYTYGVVVGDLDGDGKPDLAVSSQNSAVALRVFRNTSTSGNVSFESNIDITAGDNVVGLKMADIDGDGKLDLVTANYSSNTVSILRNTSVSPTISFAPKTDVATNTPYYGLSIADINGDGKPDLLIPNTTAATISVHQNKSTVGNIDLNTRFSIGAGPNANPGNITAADFNGDGRPDIIAATILIGGNNIALFRNTTNVPAIVSFTPLSAVTGTTVTIIGTNFSGTIAVSFGGTAVASFTVLSSTAITAVVGAGSTGSISITTAGGTATLPGFTYFIPPSISSFSPLSATAGATVTINGGNFTNVTSVSFGGTPAFSYTVLSPTTITAVVAAGSTGSVSVTTLGGAAALSGFTYLIPHAPVITSFTPTAATPNSVVTITGTDLTAATIVSFGGTEAISFTVLSSTILAATVANGSSGSVSVTSAGGTGALSGFTFIEALAITSFSPLSATTGVAVVINGSNFTDVISVKFGNTSAASFTVLSSTTIRAVVAGGASGNIQVITSGESVTRSGFNFISPPTITSFSPVIAGAGVTVTLQGTNFLDLSAVSFGGVAAASFTALSSTTVTAIVGAGASGSISITTSWAGVATRSGFTFVPAPTITSFSPVSATAGTSVLVTGTNLSAVTAVSFGGVSAFSFTILSSTSLSAVVGNGSSGSLSATSLGGTASLSGFTYIIPPAPVITSFTPVSASINSVVTITGTDLLSTTGVSFGGINASSFTVLSPTTLTAVVANGSSGSVSVTTTGGSGSLAGFSYTGAPVITSVSPLSGIAGSSVTVTGLNFNPLTSGNIIYFGATRATVTTATANSLTVLVPPGATYAPVTVLNADNHLSAASQAFFLPVFTASKASIAPSDLARTDFASGGVNPTIVLSGDMDRDGRADLVIINSDNNKVAFLLNTGTGTNISFAAPVMVDAISIPYGAVLADMDGDGRLDVVLTKLISGNNVQVLLNRSTPGVLNIGAVTPFNGNISLSTNNNNPPSVAVADIDGDGKLDMVVSNTTYNSISFFLNTGTPGGQLSFASAVNINQTVASNYSYSVAIGDIDGDGKPDLAVSSQNTTALRVFRNTSTRGNVSFESNIDLTAGDYAWGLKMADIDGDGKLDLVTTNYTSNTVSVLRNTSDIGSISFAAKADVASNTPSYGLSIADINGDGKPDLLIPNNTSTISVLQNKSTVGNIDLSTRFSIGAGSNPGSITTADFNGDGRPDIIVANNITSGNNMALFRNITNVPVIASFVPVSAATGATVTITGTNFSGTTAVSFGGTAAASFTVLSSTSITAVVGAGATGSVSITTIGGTAALSGFTYIAPPSISSFTPLSAATGATVTINGTNFSNITSVRFGGTAAASFTVLSSTTITAIVGAGSTGSISITTLGGTTALSGFTFIPPPSISSFTPLSAATGATITINGTNLSNIIAVRFGGTAAASFTVLSSTTITAIVSTGSTGSISITTAGGIAALSGFTYIPPPSIGSFTPLSAATGVTVTINGTNFSNVTSVSFGGTAAASFTVLSSTAMTAVVGAGSTGSISITTLGGTAALSGFTYIAPPSISSFTPLSAATGEIVTINGTNFSNITSVRFGGTAVASFTVLSSTTMTAIVGAGSTGSISITTLGGTTALSGFMYIPPPSISSFTPLSAATGTTVTINGTNLSNITSVSFGGTAAASFTALSSTTATAVVAAGSSGSVSVTTLGGTTALSGFIYIPMPSITSFTPLAAGTGTTVTINGTNLFNINSLSFGGTAAASFTVVSSTSAIAIVAGGSSGSISITTIGGTTALSGFTYIPPPAIGSFTPLSALPGETITINGTNLVGTNAINFGGTMAASFTVLSSTAVTAVVGSGSTGSISLITLGGTAAMSGFIFAIPPPPVISSFTPVSATAGDIVTINGLNLFAATGINFGGTTAISFTAASNTSATAMAGVGTSGNVNITTAGGTTALSGFTYIPSIPVITSFTPMSAKAGDIVTITGSKLSLTNSVSFGGTAAASFSVLSSTAVTAVVAAGSSGSISITTLGGTTALSGFTYFPPPAISSFTPMSAATGATVTINGTNLSNITSISFGGTAAASFTVLSSTAVTAVVAGGSSGSITITTSGGITGLPGFTYILPPSISSFTPLTAATGTTVTIKGTNLSNVTSVNFGGTAAVSFTVLSSTTVTAVVGAGSTGNINVTTIGGTATLSGFTYIAPPAISSFTPMSAATGAIITINGNNFSNISAISFGGRAAASFTVLSSTAATAVVANGSTGSISVTTPGGTTELPGFIYLAPPSISSFTPLSGATGTTVTINGSNFSNITSVSFGGTAAASFTVLSSTTMTAIVGAGSAGSISITTAGGTSALSGFIYIAPPVISSFTPLSATTGTIVTISGTNLSNIISVSFGGTAAASFNVLSATTITAVVATGSSGSVSITTAGGTSALSGFTYSAPVVIASPVISSFTPLSAATGQTIIITGSNLSGISAVTFGGTAAASFTVLSSTAVTAVVAAGSSGSISITTAGGTSALSGFTFNPPPVIIAAPVITSFAPLSATTGETVTIKGSNLSGITAITFGGTVAASFTVLSSTTVTAVIAAGSSGNIGLTTVGGTTTIAGFTYRTPVPAPAISSFSPLSAATGETVTIIGTNLSGITALSFGGTPAASFTVYSSTTISVVVGAGSSGSISLTTAGGTAALPGFTYATSSSCGPILNFTPQLNNITDNLFCFKNSYTLSVSNSATNYPVYRWSTGETTKDLQIDKNTTASLRVGTSESCLSNASAPIRFVKNSNPVPTVTLSNDIVLTSSAAPNYRWYYNNRLIADEVSSTYTLSRIGFYKVETSEDKTCWDASNEFPILFLPAPLVNDEVKVNAYPNPATGGTFTVVASFKHTTNVVVRVTVTNATGAILLQTNKFIFFGREIKIPLTVNARGTVFVKIDINGEVQTQTVVIP